MFRIISLGILFCFAIPSAAQSVDAIRITGNYPGRSSAYILKDIQNKYDIAFFYRDQWLPQTEINLFPDRQPLELFLHDLLEGTGLNFVFYDASVIIAPGNLLGQEFTQTYFMIKERQRSLIQSQKWATASDIIALGDSTKATDKKEVLLKGTITDQLNEEPLLGVNLYFEAIASATSTDANGNFQIILPKGYNLLEISYIGYETQKILLEAYDDAHLSLTLAPEAYELEEILITGETDNNNVQSMMIGITRIKPRQIQELPVFLGESDVIQSLLTLPGVSSVGEGASGFNVRGGNIDQNLILQDEALIFNSSHALGFFSIFNPDAIREVTLYKGHIPAQYGGRLSSVLDVKLAGNDNEKVTTSGGLGAVSSRFVIQGPWKTADPGYEGPARTSFLLGGRITYSDWVLKLINNPDIRNSSAFFYDFNIKLNHRYSNKGSVTASYYQSFDRVRFANDYGFSWNNNTLSIIWNHLLSSNLSSSFSISYGNNKNLSFEPTGINAFDLTNGIRNVRISENFFLSKFSSHQINAGGEYIHYFMEPDKLMPRTKQSTIVEKTIEKDNAHEIGVYIDDEYTINHLFSISAGIRFNLFQQLGPGDIFIYQDDLPRSPDTIIDTLRYNAGDVVKTYLALEPRFSAKYSINPVSSIKLSYNRINQYIHLVSNTTAAVPVDFWQVSGPYYAPQKADNYSIGYFKNFINNVWETSLELYYRDIHNLVAYKDLPELLLNNHLETELLSGIGRAYGSELFIRKKKGQLNGWLSYVYSRTLARVDGPTPEEKINRGEWFPSKFDKPHSIDLVLNYNVNKSNILSVNFTYSSGRPIAVPSASYIIDEIFIPHYTERNQFRIPDYHRLDISYTIKRNVIRRKRYKDSFTISVYNLYSRENAFSIFFKKQQGGITNAYKLSVLGSIFPSVTYNFEF